MSDPQAQPPLLIDVWSDVVCPWCAIGHRRLHRALSRFPRRTSVRVVHRAFQLDPSAAVGVTTSRRRMLQTRYGLAQERVIALDAQMQSLFLSEGLSFADGDGLVGNTFEAHQLLAWAETQGAALPLLERLLTAYFSESRSVFDDASLAALASDVGLSADAAREALASGRHADAVEHDLAEARAIGVTGVPFFLFGRRFAVSGAQSPEVLLEAITEAWAHRGAVPAANADADRG